MAGYSIFRKYDDLTMKDQCSLQATSHLVPNQQYQITEENKHLTAKQKNGKIKTHTSYS